MCTSDGRDAGQAVGGCSGLHHLSIRSGLSKVLFGTPSSFLIPCLPVNLPSREVGQICLYDSGFLSSFPSAFFVSCVSRYGCFSRAVPSSRRTDPVSVRLRPSPQSILPSRWLCLTAAGLRRLPSGCARNPSFPFVFSCNCFVLFDGRSVPFNWCILGFYFLHGV